VVIRAGWAHAAAILALASGAACTEFDDPGQVIDMRVLGMRADPPEVLVPYDPEDPTRVEIDGVPEVRVCALVADPADQRGLEYSFSYCRPNGDGRCRGSITVVQLDEGVVDDPEESSEPVEICATLTPGPDLATVLVEAFGADSLLGFDGVSAQVALRVGPVGGDTAETLYAFKRVRFTPQLPADREPNANPGLERLIGLREPTGERGLDFDVALGRCGDIQPFDAAPGEDITLLPVEPEGARQRYAVLTFDGGSRNYTENFTYQWLSSDGDFSPFNSGGEIDVAGNEPTLDSRWRAPDDPELIGDGLDVRIWMVQRDERGGQAWYETCARVVP
jgi:hypothetical protein